MQSIVFFRLMFYMINAVLFTFLPMGKPNVRGLLAEFTNNKS